VAASMAVITRSGNYPGGGTGGLGLAAARLATLCQQIVAACRCRCRKASAAGSRVAHVMPICLATMTQLTGTGRIADDLYLLAHKGPRGLGPCPVGDRLRRRTGRARDRVRPRITRAAVRPSRRPAKPPGRAPAPAPRTARTHRPHPGGGRQRPAVPPRLTSPRPSTENTSCPRPEHAAPGPAP
jgi:hypothetical protein